MKYVPMLCNAIMTVLIVNFISYANNTVHAEGITDDNFWRIMAMVGTFIGLLLTIIGYGINDKLKKDAEERKEMKELISANEYDIKNLQRELAVMQNTIDLCPECLHANNRVRDMASAPKNRKTDPKFSED